MPDPTTTSFGYQPRKLRLMDTQLKLDPTLLWSLQGWSMQTTGGQLLNLDLPSSFGVGDRWRDVEAAHNAGVPAIYIKRDYGERPALGALATASSLLDAVPFIEAHHQRGTTV